MLENLAEFISDIPKILRLFSILLTCAFVFGAGFTAGMWAICKFINWTPAAFTFSNHFHNFTREQLSVGDHNDARTVN